MLLRGRQRFNRQIARVTEKFTVSRVAPCALTQKPHLSRPGSAVVSQDYSTVDAAAVSASLAYREAMSHVAGAVHLITTDGPAGRAGLTATAVTSVSAEPPHLLVCLNQASRTAAFIAGNGHFAVNTLGAGQQDLADVFAGRTPVAGAARFDHGRWHAGVAGQPVLEGALATFVLKASDIRPVGSHFVVIGAVLDIGIGANAAGLVYARRAYHQV